LLSQSYLLVSEADQRHLWGADWDEPGGGGGGRQDVRGTNREVAKLGSWREVRGWRRREVGSTRDEAGVSGRYEGCATKLAAAG